MPRKLLDEQGNEVEVPTAEEIKALEDKAASADTLTTELETLKGDRNFKILRGKAEKYDKIREKAEAEGKSVDEEGNIIEQEAPMTKEEMKEIARQEATGAFIGNHLKGKLNSIADENHRKAVEIYYNKLAAGETIEDIAQIDKIFSEAERALTVEGSNGRAVIVGQAPAKADDVTLSPDAIELGKALGFESVGAATTETDKK